MSMRLSSRARRSLARLAAAATLVALATACGQADSGTATSPSWRTASSQARTAAPDRRCTAVPDPRRPAPVECVRPGSSTGAARADYNGDGFTDLAIGAPYEAIESAGAEYAGVVHVFFGGPDGIDRTRNVTIQRGTFGITGPPQDSDLFGSSVVGADFDADGFADLAIGSPITTYGSAPHAGTVFVVFGSRTGFGTRALHLTQANTRGPLPDSANSWFGAGLAWGQFGRGPEPDLAISAPYRAINGRREPSITVMYGKAGSGFDFDVTSAIVPLQREEHAGWGTVMTAGNVVGGPEDDLVVGAPYQTAPSGNRYAGAIDVYPGGSLGVTTDGRHWTQDSPNVPGSADASDNFGAALAVGDLDANGRVDLAVGVPGESSGTGAVVVFYDNATTFGSRIAYVDQGTVVGTGKPSDRWGSSLAAADFGSPDNVAGADLAVGIPGSDSTSGTDAGRVLVLYGGPNGVGSAFRVLGAGGGGPAGTGRANGRFGQRMTAWNWGQTGQADLAISHDGPGSAGSVIVAYGTPSGVTTSRSVELTQRDLNLTPESGDGFGWALY